MQQNYATINLQGVPQWTNGHVVAWNTEASCGRKNTEHYSYVLVISNFEYSKKPFIFV